MELTTVEETTNADGAEVWSVYDPVFGDQPDEATWRGAVWERHTARDGFRLVRAYEAGRAVGFTYGYTGRSGQWWTDHVRETLPAEVADAWLGEHFEVVSIGVLPGARGRGTGRALLRALLTGLPHDRLLLMTTADAGDPARRLYAAEGWDVLGPGTGDATVVMGRHASA